MRNTVMMTLAWWRPFCATLSSKRRRCRRNAKRCHPCPSLCLCSRTSPSPFLCHLCWHADFLWQGTCWLYCSPSLRSGLPRFLATTMATLSMSHCCKKQKLSQLMLYHPHQKLEMKVFRWDPLQHRHLFSLSFQWQDQRVRPTLCQAEHLPTRFHPSLFFSNASNFVAFPIVSWFEHVQQS